MLRAPLYSVDSGLYVLPSGTITQINGTITDVDNDYTLVDGSEYIRINNPSYSSTGLSIGVVPL